MERRTQAQLAKEAEARLRKERARMQLERVKLRRDAIKLRRKMLSVHRAAEMNRLTRDWIAPPTSADGEILADLPRITARARQMVRDDAWARSIVRCFRRNVVGTGITPALNDKPYRVDWRVWAEDRRAVDLEKRRTFHQFQQWAIDELITAGEAFIVRWVIGGRLVLQGVESEQLDLYKLTELSTGNEVRAGVEVDENGAPVAYHFYKQHPHDVHGFRRPMPMTLDSIRVPASMVCHVYDPTRVLQSRGISRLAPVLRKLRDLSEYDAAQLRVARAQAAIGLLIKGGDDGEDPLHLDGLNVAYLADDEEVTPFTPSRPGGEYDPFVRAQLRAIAAGVGLSYDQIARDFDGGNFSSKRQGSIEDRREFEPLQKLLISQLCEPVLQDFVFLWAMANPEQSGDFFLRDDPEPVAWHGQGWEWVDPESQGAAIERKMRLGLTTRTIEAARLGLSVTALDRDIERDGTREVVDRLHNDRREVPAPPRPESTAAEPPDPAEVRNA